MSFPKVTTAYVPPLSIARVLSTIAEHMERGRTPAITQFKVLDDRGGTGNYCVLLPELSVKEAQLALGRNIDITKEDA